MDPRLRAPALKGDVEALTTALEAGANPNLRDDDGYAPLLYAVERPRFVHRRAPKARRRRQRGGAVRPDALNTAAAGGRTEAIKI